MRIRIMSRVTMLVRYLTKIQILRLVSAAIFCLLFLSNAGVQTSTDQVIQRWWIYPLPKEVKEGCLIATSDGELRRALETLGWTFDGHNFPIFNWRPGMRGAIFGVNARSPVPAITVDKNDHMDIEVDYPKVGTVFVAEIQSTAKECAASLQETKSSGTIGGRGGSDGSSYP